MKIYNNIDQLILDIDVDDTSYRYRVIMGDHNLTLRYSLPEHVEIPVGAYCDFEGTRYTLMRPEDFKKVNSRNYDYTVVFQGVEYKARIWKFRNPVDGRLKFPLTATPREHLQMFVDNMNRRDTGWSVGDCIDGTEVLINYDHDYCKDALAKMASELKTEYHFDGKRVSLCKLEVNKSTPLPLSYGRGNGFKSGVGRANSGDTLPTEILFVQGGTENIDRSKYPPLDEPRVRASSGGCLLLPRNASLQFDGDFFEDEDGFNPDIARTYASDDLGLSIRRVGGDSSMMAEDSLDCSAIYPKRVGEVSEVVRIKREGGDLFDIIDKDIPGLLNYEKYTIGDETMTIRFQTGMLAGKEFDVKYYHNATDINGVKKKGRRFEIVPQEIDGIMMPGDCFIPDVYDKYAIFHCSLPDDYINAYSGSNPVKSGAEWDMFREAVKHLYEAEQQHFTFTGTLDGLWAKKNWANIGRRIVLGGFILFSDNDFAPEGVRVRITGIKDYVNNPHSPEIELSNSIIGASVSTTLKQLESTEVVIDESHRSAIQFTKRRFRDAKETIEMLEAALSDNFTNRINPIAVETMSLLVGDERLQYQFVSQPGSTEAVPHNIEWDESTKQLHAPAGTIQHLTLGIDSIRSSHEPNEYLYWNVEDFESAELSDGAVKYYLYIRAPKQFSGIAGSAVFRLETVAHKLEEGTNYWLLVGVLNTEYDGERSFATLYGFTEILPGRITADRLLASDGQSYFDMLNSAMKLKDKLMFNTNGDGELRLKGTIVQSQNGIDEAPLGCYRGEYNNETTYFNGDEVTYAESESSPTCSYRCISQTPITGVPPTNTLSWQVTAAGVQGEAGISPNASYKSTVFIRSNSAPATPSGGSWSNPVPAGWSDGVPAGEQKLWASTRIFTTDGKAPQQTSWTAPRQMTDTADFDVEFSSVESPSAPTGHPNTNTEWSSAADDTTIWMATSRKSNGTWGEWQVSRIRGENGQDGTSIRVKGTFYKKYASRADYQADTTTVRGRYYLIDHDEVLNEDCVVVFTSLRQLIGVGYKTTYTIATAGDAYVYNEDGHLYLADEEQWQDVGQFKGDKGNTGTPGKNAYVHIKFATSLEEGSWTANNGETPGKYIGIYTDNKAQDSDVWSDYSWMQWTGQDGLGYEFIYRRTTSSSAPATPTDTSQTTGYVPSGWTDDPTGVNSLYPYEWVCYRQRTDGQWGNFIGSATNNAVAALWAKYGQNGSTGAKGDYTEYRFAKNGSPSAPPDLDKTALNPSGWETEMPPVSSAEYLWLTKAVKNGTGTIFRSQWSTPVRMTPQDGKDGEDGKSPALVFRGTYSSSKTYYGNENRVDCVLHGSTYYIARVDAPSGVAGFTNIVPTNTNYWHQFGSSFESVATGLLLAENANIANLIFRSQRLESSAKTNGIPNFFLDGLKNIASFAAGNVVFDGASATLGWLSVVGRELLGFDDDGVLRLRLTPNALPTVSSASSSKDLVVKASGGDATFTGETDWEVAFEQAVHCYYGSEDTTDDIDMDFNGWVEFDIAEDNTLVDLSDIQFGCSVKRTGSSSYEYLSCSMSAYVQRKVGSSWENIGSVSLNGVNAKITIPKAGRIRISFNGSVSEYVGYDCSGKFTMATQSIRAVTAKTEMIIAKDGIMAIYNANYLRMHSTEGFIVKIGSNGLRVTTSGIQKTTNGGSSWSNL